MTTTLPSPDPDVHGPPSVDGMSAPTAPTEPTAPAAVLPRLPPPPGPGPSVYPELKIYAQGEKRGDGQAFVNLPDRPNLDQSAWGICLSGGGIRSASFSLGAIQEMHRHNMVCGNRKATYLAAVSGGGYLAGALTALAEDPNGVTIGSGSPPDGTPPLLPFAEGSPEEHYLRARARYLSHGRGGPGAAIATYFLGVLLNLVILLGAVYVAGRLVGWLYGYSFPQFRRNYTQAHCPPAHTAICSVHYVATPLPDWAVPVALGLVGAAVLVGGLWASGARWSDNKKSIRHNAPWLAPLAWGLLASAALMGVVFIGIPHLVEFLRVDLPRLGVGSTPKGTANAVSGQASRQAGTTLSWGALVAFAGTVVTGLGGIVASAKSVEPNLTKEASSLTRKVVTKCRRQLVQAVEWVCAPLLFVCVALAAVVWGAGMPPLENGGSFLWDVLVLWVVPLAMVVALWWFGNITAWSPHTFYRDRLGAAFNLEWRRGDTAFSTTAVPWRGGRLDVAPRCGSTPIDRMQPSSTPELLVCAAANVSDYGTTATGARVSSFVMSSRWIGGPAVGSMTATDYVSRTRARGEPLDLLTALSISGGAVAPEMGRMTRTSLEKLLTLANIRLGAWLPNPRWVADGRALGRGGNKYKYRANPSYLVKELLGRNRADDRYIYVSDGGHYENLGLVELLRRGCKWVWCIDASGDGADTFNTIGEALTLAHAELGVTVTNFTPEDDIAADPKKTADRKAAGKPALAKAPFCLGKINYPGSTEQGTLVYVRAAVAKDTPWEVRAFHEKNPRFPCDPTSNQLYTGDRVDAYRALGIWAAQQAWEAVAADFDAFRDAGR